MMRRTLVLGLAALVAACAGGSRYANLPEKNLVVRTETSGARAVLGVHAVDAQCKLTYEGFVELDQPVMRVGIPEGRTSYLVFEFATSSFWGGRRGSITRETLLRPRPGASYDVRVSYKDDLYDVVVRETTARGSRSRMLELAGLGACRP
jgi:hypothetical protein